MEAFNASWEGTFSRVLQTMSDRQEMPTGDDFRALMVFVAHSYLRVPARWAIVRRFIERLGDDQLAYITRSREDYERLVASQRHADPAAETFSFDEMLAFIRDAKPKAVLPKNLLVGMLWQGVQDLYPWLMEEQWTLFLAPKGAGEYFLTDDPVVRSDAGWLMPLGSEMALSSRRGNLQAKEFANRVQVASLNSILLARRPKIVVARSLDGEWIRNDNRLCRIGELFQLPK
jgi:hypothetical protein